MKLSVQEEKFVRQLLSTREIPYPKLPIKDHTTPEENKILGAFTERKLVPLEGVPTYEYMTNMNLCLNSCSSAVNCTLGCGTLGYLVLTAHPAVFSPPLRHSNYSTNKSGHPTGHAQPSTNGHDFVQIYQNPQTRSSFI